MKSNYMVLLNSQFAFLFVRFIHPTIPIMSARTVRFP